MNTKRQMKNRLILLFALITLIMAACTPTTGGSVPPAGDADSGLEDVRDTAVPPTDEPDQPVEPDQPDENEFTLQNIIWMLQSYAEQSVISGTEVTIEFGADGQLSGSAGCNNYFGSYLLDGESMTIDGVGSTEMWCEGRMDQESAYLSMLLNAIGVTPAEGTLTIHTSDGDLVFTEAADSELEGDVTDLQEQMVEQPVITLERTPCFGFCPVYRLQIFADGMVNYEGIDFVGVAGKQTIQVDPALVSDLRNAFIEAGYLTWEDAYVDFSVTDMPTVITSVTIDGSTKRIERYGGDQTAPDALVELEDLVDAAVNSAQWTRMEGSVEDTEDEAVVSGLYIVSLKIDLLNEDGSEQDGKSLREQAEALVALTGGELVNVLDIINGFVVAGLTDEDVAILAKNPLVMSIEPDRLVTLDPIEMPDGDAVEGGE